MSFSDPVSDMLTRIRNAHLAGHEFVNVPHSRLKGELARILKKEGYILDYQIENGLPKTLRIYLKYVAENQPAIRGLRRYSRPGYRRYAGAREIPRILGGMGIAVLSTSRGIMTDAEARKKNVGGELVCTVW